MSRIFSAPKKYPDYYQSYTCENCGKPVFYEPWDAVYLHIEYDKWSGDNGYWCFENNYKLSASPIKEKEK